MRSGAKSVKLQGMLEGDRHHLENAWWRIEFDPHEGHICRLFDKKNKLDVLQKGNVLAAVVDSSDTWGHDYEEWRQEAGRFGNAKLNLLELGAVRATVWVQSTFGKSLVDQFITLYRDVDTIDCVFRINWQERYTMLKLGYETHIVPGQATYDAPYGCQERNTQGFEEPGQKWVDLTGTIGSAAYGFAVLNDSKYGFDVLNGAMRVTMLRSPAYAHHDRARHDASTPYTIMDQGWQTVKMRLVPHAGPWEEAGVVRKSWELNESMVAHIESAHSGSLPPRASFVECSADNVALTVVKRSEEGNALVIRGYETAGREANTRVELPHLKQSLEVPFKPHEIKTLRIDKETWEAAEVNLLEE
jgi:alpha-mannosidase